MTQVQVDIVSDVVCPWCVIGYRQLAAAAEQLGIDLDIRWHPFELNPDMAADGENLRAHLAAKYGTTLENSIKARAKLTALGAELGFTFNYTDDMRMRNTFQAHQLLHWAAEFGRAHDLKMALFEAFFTHRLDINDPGILADLAGGIGLDAGAAAQALATGAHAEAVRETQAFWIRQGVSGVPAMVFQGKYLVSGAQGVETYVQVLRQLAGEQAA